MKTILLLSVLLLSLIPSTIAAEIIDMPSRDWLITKQTGDETNLLVNVIANKTHNVIVFSVREGTSREEKDALLLKKITSDEQNQDVKRLANSTVLTIPADKKWIKYGTSTLLLEQDEYWNITNQKNSYYISKTGFQVSNQPNISYANVAWQLEINGTLHDSHTEIWEWTIDNSSQEYVKLTGESELTAENLKWIATWYLDNNDNHITITLTTNDTTQPYSQRVVHSDISISNNSFPDFLFINGSNFDLSQTFNKTNEPFFRLHDTNTNEYLELIHEKVTDATIELKNGTVTLYSNMKTLILRWVDPIATGAFLFATFNATDATTSSPTYVTIFTGQYNTTFSTISIVSANFNAERTAGGGAGVRGDWRLLANGVEIGNTSLQFTANAPDFGTVRGGTLTNVGINNVTLQHRVAGNTLETRDITVIVNTLKIDNLSSINAAAPTFDNQSVIPNTPINLTSNTLDIMHDNSAVSLIVSGGIQASGSTDIELFISFGNQTSSPFLVSPEDADDIQNFFYIARFQGLAKETHDFSVSASQTGSETVTIFETRFAALELINDNLATNHNLTLVPFFDQVATTSEVASMNFFINDGKNGIIAVVATGQKSAAGIENTEYTLVIDGEPFPTQEKQFGTTNSIFSGVFIFTNLPENISTNTTHTFSFNASGDKVNLINTTLLFIESVDLETGVIVAPCVENWVVDGTECQNLQQFITYTDTNTCGTTDDLPADNGTTQTCTLFDCQFDTNPFHEPRLEWFCKFPTTTTTNSYNCISTVTKGNEILQTNPKQKTITGVGTITSFAEKNGLVNAYFTNENLRREQSFNFTVTCHDTFGIQPTEQVTHELFLETETQNTVGDRLVWLVQNAGFVLGLFIAIVVLILAFKILPKFGVKP